MRVFFCFRVRTLYLTCTLVVVTSALVVSGCALISILLQMQQCLLFVNRVLFLLIFLLIKPVTIEVAFVLFP
jgi:hypothetical protein